MSQVFKLKNGTVLLSTEAPGGIYNSSQLRKIAELCSQELAIVKATEDQRLALFVTESEVAQVSEQLRSMGLGIRHYQDSLHQPVSCLGELCEDHEQPAMSTTLSITSELANIRLDNSLKIGVNGCARCCTPCHTLDVSVVGDAFGYRISLGGKTQQVPEFATYFAEGVPANELPARLRSVVEIYQRLAENGESLHDVIERCGAALFIEALAPYSQDASIDNREVFSTENGVPALEESIEDFTDSTEATHGEADTEESTQSDELEMIASFEDREITVGDSKPGHLEEIPIKSDDRGALADDLPLDDLKASLDRFDDDAHDQSVAEVFETPVEENLLEAEIDDSVEELVMDFDSIEADASDRLPADEDLSGLPELEEDLIPEPSPGADTASLMEQSEDFSAELPSDAVELSDSEEDRFEERLQVSIEEESRLIAREENDSNLGERAAALSLLENSLDDEESFDLDVLDEVSIQAESFEAEPEQLSPALNDSSPEVAVEQYPAKANDIAPATGESYRVSAITFPGEHLRLNFESGAYLDFDLSSLSIGEEKHFRLGEESLAVTSTVDGYVLEIGGMRLFHPKMPLSRVG